jgi:allograft inflammatory factor 1
MSAKLAKQLLNKGKPEAPKPSSPKGVIKKAATPDAPKEVAKKIETAPKDVTICQPSAEAVKQFVDARCKTVEEMDDIQRFCHLNPPPPPPPPIPETASVNAESQSVDSSPELSNEAKEFIEKCNNQDGENTVRRPPSPPSPASLLHEDADEFISLCNKMGDNVPAHSPSAPSSEEKSKDSQSPEELMQESLLPTEKENEKPIPDSSNNLEVKPPTLPDENPAIKQTDSNSKTSSSCATVCQMEGLAEACTQAPFKNGYCIDHYRLQKNPPNNHKFLNADGQARLSIDKHCDKINKKFMMDRSYETTQEQMEDLKKRFMEMDEDGSGDIDVLELGRAMEKLGKPKNQLQLRKMIAEVDVSGSGTIEYEEFVLMMVGSSSSVLRLILLFEKKAQGEKPPPKGKKKPMINLYA